MNDNRPLIAASREEGKYLLHVKSGTLPSDWYGHIFINSPAGTVNSNGLPYPADSQEVGSPIMNGDGFVYRFDLGPENVAVTTKLMKPPCYYADLATKRGNANGFNELFEFRNLGLTRMSLDLGGRNELNTAVTPFKFKGDRFTRMLACYDAGRPWEIDARSLDMVTAIGANSEYKASTPDYLFPFPVLQSTAHPSFDPRTQELFIVNYTKSFKTLSEHEVIVEMLKGDIKSIEHFLEGIIHHLGKHRNHEEVIDKVEELIPKHEKEHETKVLHWLKGLFHAHKEKIQQKKSKSRLLNWFRGLLQAFKEKLQKKKGHTSSNDISDDVFLLRWSGKAGPLDKWKVVDKEGKALVIHQCMHQTTLTEDYILLADASFKFAFDLLFNSPFKSKKIDEWIRHYLTLPQEPFLDLYIIKRADLDPSKDTVVGEKLKKPIPLEAVHFSADYSNPKGIITLHLAHNSAACLAEFVRTFDTLAPDGKHAVDPEVVGLMSVGCMDIGRIGKVGIDAEKAEIISQSYITEPGNLVQPEQIGVHTWGVGLYTFRDIVSADKAVEKIRHIYWSSYGLNPKLLTKFIYDLYDNYPNRKYTPEQINTITQRGIPFVLSRQNTETMKLEDFYQFDPTVTLMSVQFVPRISQAPEVTDDIQKDGYIFTTELVNYPNEKGKNYQCEIWIFKGWDLASGPCCKLTSPNLDYAFTLHSAWAADAISMDTLSYSIDPKEDYDPIINKLKPAVRQSSIQHLFDTFIYPHFKK
jgi:hypothetical protein